MRHLNDWDQHFMQIRSESLKDNSLSELASESEHSGEVVSSASWIERLFAKRTPVEVPQTEENTTPAEPTLH